MHSSRMRIARQLTVSGECVCVEGAVRLLRGGVFLLRGEGVCLV